jgi:hypothetical protein
MIIILGSFIKFLEKFLLLTLEKIYLRTILVILNKEDLELYYLQLDYMQYIGELIH